MGEDNEKIGPYEFYHPDGLPAVTEDPYHLVDFLINSPQINRSASLIDIGTATGVIPLLLASRTDIERITGVEVDSETALAAQENVTKNELGERITIVKEDYRDLPEIFKAGTFDIVVSNPPYIKYGHGRESTDKRRRLARYEELGEIRELINIAKYLLKTNGRLFMIFPYRRYDELMKEIKSAGFRMIRKEFIHGKDDGPIKLFMVEAGR